jgi:1-pyrroline-5-carboxylate dehydrogenase
VYVVQGSIDENQWLLQQQWDYIFFTGGPFLGKIVAKAAAEKLIPVTLELGGKSPAIIEKGCDMKTAAKRVIWGKSVNAGQTCIAPDYVWVHSSEKQLFINAAKEALLQMYGGDMLASPDYGRMVNERSFDRVSAYLQGADVVLGGRSDREEKFIETTVVAVDGWSAPVMCEEIFGPVLTMYVYPEKKYSETLQILDETSPYALTGAIISQDREAIDEATSVLKNAAGNFYINDKPTGAVVGQQPFGGGRASGTNDKAGAKINLLRWVSPRTFKETFTPPTDYKYSFLQAD